MDKVFLLLFLTGILYSQDLDKVRVDSSLTRLTDNFYIKAGGTPPFFTKPLSYSKVPLLYKNKLYFTFKGVYLEPNIKLTFNTGYMNKLPESPLTEYWYNRWVENEPLFNLGFIAGNNFFHIRNDLDVRADFPVAFNNLYSNIPVGDLWYQDFDFNFPTRGFLVFGVESLNLMVGRDKIHFGPGQKVGLFLSKEPSFFNQLLLTYESKSFKGSFFTLALESYLTDKEKAQLEFFFDPVNGYSDLWSVKFEKSLEDQSKIITGHRFEFKLIENLVFSFNDMLVLGGRVSNFEDMTPTMFFHNIYGENYSNVMIGFDLFWTVFPGFGVYGEYIIDDIRNIHEGDLTVPTSMGYLGGVKFIKEAFGGDLTVSLEGSVVDEFTYRRWHPLQSFYTRRKYYSIKKDNNVYDNAVGAFLGPGSTFLSIWADFDKVNKLSISSGWEYWRFYNGRNLITQELITAYRDGLPGNYNQLQHLYFKIQYNIKPEISISACEVLQIGSELFYYLNIGLSYKF